MSWFNLILVTQTRASYVLHMYLKSEKPEKERWLILQSENSLQNDIPVIIHFKWTE